MTEVVHDFVLYCGNCNLVYRPDERTHKEPYDYCPRCGAELRKADKMSRDQFGGET